MKNNNNFNEDNILNKEYELLKLAIPHHDEFQAVVGDILSSIDTVNPKIIEIGCGTGITTSIIDKAIDADITSVDIEESMITRARSKEYRNNVNFTCSDIINFLKKQEDDSIDVVVSGYTLHNLEARLRQEVCREIYRVLKTKGLFINADKMALDNKLEYKKVFEEQIAAYDIFRGIGHSDLADQWVKHYHVDNSEDIVLVEGDYKGCLSEISFGQVDTVYREKLECVVVAKKI